MSRLRANIVVNKEANGPFLASEGINVSSNKKIVLQSGCTISGATANTHIRMTTADFDTLNVDNIHLGDNNKVNLGVDNDLQLYHDGSNSYIVDSGTGNLYVRADNVLALQKVDGENYVFCNADGAVELYHNNQKKFNTAASGVTISGGVTATSGWKGTTTSANVLGGISMPFVCGRNGRIALPIVNATMLFGGSEYSDDNTQGVLMPHNGKLVAATLNAENVEGNSEIQVLVNGTKNSSYKFNITSSVRGDFNQIQTWYNSPLSFSAGDRINFAFATTTITYMEVLSITFFVVFD